MPLLDTPCETCRGYGYLVCSDCPLCGGCQGIGVVPCTLCQSGRVPCRQCGGTSKIEVRRGRFFIRTLEERCTVCSNGTVECPACKGTLSLTCPSCHGAKRVGICSHCKGTQHISCTQCAGSGRVASEWSQSLRWLTADNLRFEHEKLRSDRTSLERKLSRLQTEYDRAWDYYNHWQDRATNEGWLDVFYSAGNQEPVDAAKSKVNAAAKEVAELEKALGLVAKHLQQRISKGKPDQYCAAGDKCGCGLPKICIKDTCACSRARACDKDETCECGRTLKVCTKPACNCSHPAAHV